MKEILNIIHKTIYQFFDACEKDAPMSDKDKLLLEVNKAICNNLKSLNVPNTNVGGLIRRQEVSDIIKTRLYQTALNNTEYITSYDKVCEDIAENRIDTWINEVKSVDSERKTGKWIRGKSWSVGIGMGEQYGYFYKCSECGKEVKGGYTKCTDRFCKSCGAKMRVNK